MGWKRSVGAAGFSPPPIGPTGSSSLLCWQPPLYCGAPQLPQSIRRNPSSRARVAPAQLFCNSNCFSIQLYVSFSDIGQRPVYRLPYEVPLVLCFPLDDLQIFLKHSVRRRLVMNRQICCQRESGAFLELFFSGAPRKSSCPRRLCKYKQVTACSISNVPTVKVLHPSVHQRGRYTLFLRDHSRPDSSIEATHFH